MKILHVYNRSRSGGSSFASTQATIEISRQNGLEVESFARGSGDLPSGVRGKLQAAVSAFYAPGSVRDFLQTLDRCQPDILHCNELFPLISPRILRLAKARNIAIVVTTDNYHFTCPVRNHFRNNQVCTECLDGKEHRAILNNCRNNLPESIINALYNRRIRVQRSILDYANHFITCSEFTRQWLIDHTGIEDKRISAIPHAVEIPQNAAQILRRAATHPMVIASFPKRASRYYWRLAESAISR